MAYQGSAHGEVEMLGPEMTFGEAKARRTPAYRMETRRRRTRASPAVNAGPPGKTGLKRKRRMVRNTPSSRGAPASPCRSNEDPQTIPAFGVGQLGQPTGSDHRHRAGQVSFLNIRGPMLSG